MAGWNINHLVRWCSHWNLHFPASNILHSRNGQQKENHLADLGSISPPLHGYIPLLDSSVSLLSYISMISAFQQNNRFFHSVKSVKSTFFMVFFPLFSRWNAHLEDGATPQDGVATPRPPRHVEIGPVAGHHEAWSLERRSRPVCLHMTFIYIYICLIYGYYMVLLWLLYIKYIRLLK